MLKVRHHALGSPRLQAVEPFFWLPVGSRWNVLAVVLSVSSAARTKGPGRLWSKHARVC